MLRDTDDVATGDRLWKCAEAAVVMVGHWPADDKQRVAIHFSVLGSSVVLQV